MSGPAMPLERRPLARRLLAAVATPQQTCAALRGRETAMDWLLPMVVASVVGLAAYGLTAALNAEQTAAAARQAIEQLPADKKAGAEQAYRMFTWFGWLMVPIGLFFSLVTVAWVCLLLGRLVFRAEVTYRQMLVAKAHASLVVVPEWIARALLVMVGVNPDRCASPGAWLTSESLTHFPGRVLHAINVFDLWQVGVLTLGVAAMARLPVRRVAIALTLLWAAWVLYAAAAGSAAPQAPGS